VKTQIIRIETHDDVISIKDKMGWGQTPRILLVWPQRGEILNRRLDLVYLKRHTSSLGAQLAFVTKDSDVRYFAKKLNIPVYSNIRKAEKSRWRRPKRHLRFTKESKLMRERLDRPDLEELRKHIHTLPKSWLVHPITRVLFFTLGVMGVLAIAAIFVPSAKIKLSPKTTWDAITIPVSASIDIDSIDLSGNVPAQVFNIIIEGRGNLPTSGRITIPDKKSQGKVVFVNMTDATITVPKGLIVSTKGEDPVRFATLDSADLPPDSSSELIPVEAVLAGNRGNVLSNHILVIEGPSGLDLTVTNPIGTSKGSDQLSPAPTDKDYQDLSKKLLADLYITAIDELNNKLDTNDLVLWTDPSKYEILEENFDPSDIRPTDNLVLTLRVEYQAYIVTRDMLSNIGQAILETNSPAGYSPIPSTLKFDHLQPPTPNEEMVFKWDMNAKWQMKAEIDTTQAVQLVLFRKPEEAVQQLLDNIPIGEDISITISPSWWPRLPILPFRVNVVEIQ